MFLKRNGKALADLSQQRTWQSGVDQNPMPLFTLQILSELLMIEVEVTLDSTLIVALVTITLTILNEMA